MTAITEDYVSFEIAKLLKEKGFQAKCTACYHSHLNNKFELISGRINYCNPRFSKCKTIPPYNAPTLQMAMKWLREVYDLQIIFIPVRTKQHKNWTFEIYKEFIPLYIDVSCFSTYEEACEAAIKYCLENLI